MIFSGTGGQVLGGGDDGLAGQGLEAGGGHGTVLERGGGQFALDRLGEVVAGLLQRGQDAIGARVGGVAGAGALHGPGARLQGGRAELADAGVQLLVAGPERGDRGRTQRAAGTGQDLRDDPAVGLVVIAQAGQVQQGGPDVGLVDPGAFRAAARDGDLAAVRAGGAGARTGRVAVQAEMPDPRAGDAEEVGVYLGGVVAVVPGEPGVLGDTGAGARRRARGQEVVGLGEHRERRRTGRVGVDDVQDRLFGRVGQVVGDVLGRAGVRVGRGEAADVLLELAYLGRVRGRLPGHVELRRGVVLQAERGGVALLGGGRLGDVPGQFAE